MQIVVKILARSPNGYQAVCPALPGCIARGATEHEAKANIEKSVRGYLASLNVAIPATFNCATMTANAHSESVRVAG